MFRVIYFLCLVCLSYAQIKPWYLNFTTNAVATGAVCLDGSPSGYYTRKGAQANKWVIHIQGGGWCYNENDCVGRSQSILGSSKQWPVNLPHDFVDESVGIVSDDPKVNPDFNDWSMAWLAYCDGASFSGDVSKPVQVGNNVLYFRGKRILEAVFQDLETLHGLSSATEVILTGTSAGGLATYMHADYVSSRLPNARVVAVPDAGYFMDVPDVKNNTWIRTQYQYVFKMQNATGGVHQTCIAKTPVEEQWKCFFAAYTYPHVQTPMFVINSMYDTWQLTNIIAPPADGVDWNACVGGSQPCTDQQLQTFQDFRNEILASFHEQGVTSTMGNGVFALSCFIHALTVDDFYWTTPAIAGKTMRDAFADWYYKRNTAHVLIDCPWPCNPHCKGI